MRHAFFDGFQRRNDGGVVSIDDLTDVGKGHIRHLSDHVHRNMTGIGDILGSLGADDILLANVIFAVHGGEDLVHRYGHGLGSAQKLRNAASGQLHGDAAARQKALGTQLLDGTLDLTDVGAEILCEEGENVIGNGHVDLICLLLDDGGTELQIRRLDIRDETPLKAGLESILQRLDFTGRAVGGHDDLLTGLMKGIEGVEELLLRGGLAGDELNIVDEEHVAIAVLIPELVHGLTGEGVDHLVGEILALDVDHADVADFLLQLVGNGVKQVSFTQTAGAVDEEGIVCPNNILYFGHLPRKLCQP